MLFPAVPEGSSHARKAARRQKRERQRQERYSDYRLERKKLDHHTEQSHLSPSQLSDPRFPPHTNPQMAKWIREQNALHQSEKGSEVEAFGSTSSISNIAERDIRAGSPVPSFATSSSRPTRGSLERHLYRTGSPPVRDSSGPPSRQNDRHSPFDMLESYEGHTMSDTGSKFSDYSIEPEYNMPPKSAPPTNLHHRPSYKDAFNASISSQPMANSLTPFSQQHNPSQQAHLDKLSMDVMYHTQLSGASLSGISSIVPRLQQSKGDRPYLGKVHLKELDGDEIDMEKQRIKLMFYEKQNRDRVLQEQEGTTSPKQGSSSGGSRTGYPSSPITRDFQSPPNLKDEAAKAFLDEEDTSPNTTHLLQELETLEQLAVEQRRRYKEFRFARERESLNLKQAEVRFQEQELLGPGSLSMNPVHQERWQKEQKKRLRSLERFRAEQKDKMQKIEAEEHRAKSKLKALEANILTLRQQLSERELGGRDSAAGLVEPHMPETYHPDHLPAKLPPECPPGSSLAGGAPHFVDELQGLRNDQVFRPIEPEQAPEREWPKDVGPKSNPGRFISMESVNSSSLVGNEIPEFSREIVNTISESTNMTEPTQDDPVPMKWPDKYGANHNIPDNPYAAELQPKFSFSDDEFYMDDERPRRMRDEPMRTMEAPPLKSVSEKEQQSVPYLQDYQMSRLPNGHSHHYYHQGVGAGNVLDQVVKEGYEAGKQLHRGQVWSKQAAPHHRDKPPHHTSGRIDHHYSRSNRPRHTRSTPYGADNTSTVSGVSATTARNNTDYPNSDGLKVPDVVPMSTAYSPSTIHTSSPPLVAGHPTGERNASPLNRVMEQTAPHSPSSIPPPQQSAYFPFREHPPQHSVYAVPTSSGPLHYDVPKKPSVKAVAPVAIYDQPRPTLSPQQTSNHAAPQSPQSSYPPDSNRSPYHKMSDRGGVQQHYDVPKLALDQNRTVEREMRQAPSNPSPYPHQYHGLPTKPSGRSYSRGRQDAMGYSDRGFRGQHSRQAQRVQRQQTEL